MLLFPVIVESSLLLLTFFKFFELGVAGAIVCLVIYRSLPSFFILETQELSCLKSFYDFHLMYDFFNKLYCIVRLVVVDK